MKQLSTADNTDISIDEATVYCCLSVLMKQLSTADISIDEATIYCCITGIDKAAI